MAAVRPLKAKDKTAGLAPVPAGPTLAERLAEAQRAAEAPARRVAGLEAAMADALARQDYAAAERIKNELGDARLEHGITSSQVAALQGAIVEAERRQAEDSRILAEAQAKTEARRVVEDATVSERRALEGIDQALEECWSALAEAKAAFARAQGWELKAYQERARAHQAMVTLGERENGQHITRPNRASVLAEQDKLIMALLRWAR